MMSVDQIFYKSLFVFFSYNRQELHISLITKIKVAAREMYVGRHSYQKIDCNTMMETSNSYIPYFHKLVANNYIVQNRVDISYKSHEIC